MVICEPSACAGCPARGNSDQIVYFSFFKKKKEEAKNRRINDEKCNKAVAKTISASGNSSTVPSLPKPKKQDI